MLISYLGTHVGGDIERVSDLPALRGLHGLLDELVVDPFLHIDARSGHADLPLDCKFIRRLLSIRINSAAHHHLQYMYNNVACDCDAIIPTLLKKMASRDRLTAMSTSASSKMMSGDLPPSSRETGLRLLLAADSMMRRPTSVDPVNAT